MMKKFTLLLSMMLLGVMGVWADTGTVLASGDIAITGFNFDNPDQVSIVFLVDVVSGTEFYITDNGWKSDNTWRTGEGIHTFTANQAYSAGDEIVISTSNTAFSGSGDQIIIYQGASTMVAAVNSEGAEWQSDATSSNTSALPQGLTEGINCIAFNEIDNSQYTGLLRTGTKSELLAAINNTSNWIGSNSVLTLTNAGFTVTTGGTPSDTLPVITNYLPESGSEFEKDSVFIISATVTTEDAAGLDSVCLITGGIPADTLRMTPDVDTFTIEMMINTEGTYSGKVMAFGSNGETAISASHSVVIVAPQMTALPYTEDFATDFGQCYTYSVSGDTKEWTYSSGAVEANGYNSGDTEEDWLVFPGVDLDAYKNEKISFTTSYNHGTDDASNYLKLMYSSDYKGIGDPSVASWSELSYTQPSGTNTVTPTGDIDISAIAGSKVYFALKYHYESGSYRAWTVDDVALEGTDTASLAPVILSVQPADGDTAYLGDTAIVIARVGIPSGTLDSVIFAYGDPMLFTAPMIWNSPGTYVLPVPITEEKSNYYKVIAYGNGDTTSTDVRTLISLCPMVDAPVATAASDAQPGSFIAHWESVAEADHYLLDVWSEVNMTTTSDLIISAYVEGSSSNKYLGIYNGTGSDVDLSAYTLELYANGSATPSNSNVLSGTLADGATIVYANSSATVYSGASTNLSTCNFNGDDVPVLVKDGDIIDVAGPMGNPNNNNYAENITLYRKSSIGMPTVTFNMDDWDSYANDYVTDLGNHSFTGAVVDSFFIQDSIVGNVLSQEVTDLASSTDYFYAVKTVNAYGCESAASNHITVTTGTPVAVVPLEKNEMTVFASKGLITVKAADEQMVSVYDITGRQISSRLMKGEATIAVKNGLYLVRVADTVVKVAVE